MTTYIAIGNKPDNAYAPLSEEVYLFYSAELDKYIDFWQGEFVWTEFPTFYTKKSGIEVAMENGNLDKFVRETIGWEEVTLVPATMYFADMNGRATSVFMETDFTEATAAL